MMLKYSVVVEPYYSKHLWGGFFKLKTFFLKHIKPLRYCTVYKHELQHFKSTIYEVHINNMPSYQYYLE